MSEDRPHPLRRAAEPVIMAAAKATEESKQDDLVQGFAETGPSGGKSKAFFASTTALSLWAWYLAFTWGAYGSPLHIVNFTNLQRIFVVSLVALLGTLAMRKEVRVHKWMLLAFTPTPLLILLRAFAPTAPPKHSFPKLFSAGPWKLAEEALVGATFLAAPFLLWVFAHLLAPQFFTIPGGRAKVSVFAIVALVAALGYLIGRYNYRFVTCEDFAAAGNEPPAHCTHEDPGRTR